MPKQKREQTPFERYLRKQNLSENTLTSYLWTVKYYSEHYEEDHNLTLSQERQPPRP